jgi:hypothetical protein
MILLLMSEKSHNLSFMRTHKGDCVELDTNCKPFIPLVLGTQGVIT